MVSRTLLVLLPVFDREHSLEGVLSIPDPPKQAGLFCFNLGLATFTWSLTPYRGDSFLTTVSSFLVETVSTSAGFLELAGGGGAAGGGAEDRAPAHLVELVTYLDEAGFLLLLLIGVVGCLYVLAGSRGTHLSVTLAGSLAVMVVFVLGLPLFGIRNFVPGRWFAFMYVPLVLLGLIGVRYLSLRLPAWTAVAGIALLVVALPGVMLVASPAVADSPPVEEVQLRYGYTGSELAAVEATDRYVHADRTIYTDHPYQTVVERTGAQPAEPATVAANGTSDHDLVLYRTEQSGGTVYFEDTTGQGYRRTIDRRVLCAPSMDAVYDNGDAALCRR
jgi:hypothetical protein